MIRMGLHISCYGPIHRRHYNFWFIRDFACVLFDIWIYTWWHFFQIIAVFDSGQSQAELDRRLQVPWWPDAPLTDVAPPSRQAERRREAQQIKELQRRLTREGQKAGALSLDGLRAEGSKLLTRRNWIFLPDNVTAFVSLLTSQSIISINTNKNAILFDNNMARFCHTQIIPYGSLWLLEPCYRRWRMVWLYMAMRPENLAFLLRGR